MNRMKQAAAFQSRLYMLRNPLLSIDYMLRMLDHLIVPIVTMKNNQAAALHSRLYMLAKPLLLIHCRLERNRRPPFTLDTDFLETHLFH